MRVPYHAHREIVRAFLHFLTTSATYPFAACEVALNNCRGTKKEYQRVLHLHYENNMITREDSNMRRTLTAYTLTALVAFASVAEAQTSPSLAERRAIAVFEKDSFPALHKSVQTAAGFEVPIKVDWNSLALPGDDKYYGQDDYLVKTVFTPLENAMKDIARDEMGKQALREKLQAINIHYTEAGSPASAYKDRVKFEAGTLDVNFRPFTNSADVDDRTKAIVDALEAAL